ncbi:Methyl-accepting chemotaxis protein [Olavius sp. associated proteobacterium Delta 1]|nr:Methyl-accepting chemotaxis protein [Olavius sp. associated proteobacterium Delta 1]
MKSIREVFSKIGNWDPFRLISHSIRKKLLVATLSIALIPLVIIGAITYNEASNSLMEKALDNLEAIRSTKATAIGNYFDERKADMNVLRETVFTMQQEAFDKLTTVREYKRVQIENYFLNRLGDAIPLSTNATVVAALMAFEKAGRVDGPEWETVEQKFGPWFEQYRDTYGYSDLYVISASGKVLYTVEKESDLGQNLNSGELKNSPAGQAFQKGLKGVSLQDFGIYEPAGGIQLAFMAAPVKAGGRIQGVIMGQIPVDNIDMVIQERTGLSQTTEVYLVSQSQTEGEFELRSERFVKEGDIGDPESSPFLAKAVAGESGTGFQFSKEGIYELSAYAPVRIPGVNWAINVTASVEEIISPKYEGAEEDYFTYYKEGYGYYNLYLVSPDGYLFYSVEHEPDYHTNLLNGPYKDTNLGRLVAEVLDTKQLRIADFEKYAPSLHAPAGFIAQPIVLQDNVELIVVAQLSMDQIDVIMQDHTGLGATGETYLVGPDKMWRSDSRFLDDLSVETTILNPKVQINTDAVRDALSGESATSIADNYRDIPVLSSWSSLMIQAPSKLDPNGVQWAIIADINLDEVRKPVVRLAWISAIVLGATFILVVLLSMAIAGGLTRQINHIKNLFSDIGMGEYAARTRVVSRDELGTMAASLNAMLDNTLTLIQSSAERDAMQTAVVKLLNEISALTEGDLTARAVVTEDFTGSIADSFNDMAEQLTKIVKDVKGATLEVSNTSTKISSSTRMLAQTSKKQSAQISESIAAIDMMAASIQEVAEQALQSTTVSEQSMINAKDGATAVQETNKAMDTIRERVQETARAIKRLGESSQEIGNIVQIINEIADRTSILALNASIQAAMAGDAGRGFAVVAEEVQRLAERSTNSTKQIETLVKNIQGEINEAGTRMDESIQHVVEGSKLADDAHNKLQEIETVSSQVAGSIQKISVAAKQQAKDSESISKTMEEIGKISSQTSTASRHTAESMQNMAQTAENLRVSVEAFKLEEDQENQDNEPTSLKDEVIEPRKLDLAQPAPQDQLQTGSDGTGISLPS